MLLDQPGHQSLVIRAQVVPLQEFLCFHGTQFRVAATTALGNVMEKTCQVKQLGLGNGLEDTAAQRKLVGMFFDREATQIAYHKQGVFIHGIGVKQVVLHLSYHLAILRQITRQYPVAAHPGQLRDERIGCLEQIHEQFVVHRIGAEGFVDQIQVQMPGFLRPAERVEAIGVARHLIPHPSLGSVTMQTGGIIRISTLGGGTDVDLIAAPGGPSRPTVSATFGDLYGNDEVEVRTGQNKLDVWQMELARGVARLYRELVGGFVLDERDQRELADVEALGLHARAVDTIMRDTRTTMRLAEAVLELAAELR